MPLNDLAGDLKPCKESGGGRAWLRVRCSGSQLYAVGKAGGRQARERGRGEKWTRVLMDGPDGGREQSGMNALLCGARAESFARRSLRDRVHGWKKKWYAYAAGAGTKLVGLSLFLRSSSQPFYKKNHVTIHSIHGSGTPSLHVTVAGVIKRAVKIKPTSTRGRRR